MLLSQLSKTEFIQNFKDVSRKGADIQALIARGYNNLPAAKYLLLTFINPTQVKQSLQPLISLITCTNNSPDNPDIVTELKEPHALNIAFTACGLRKLGLSPDVMDTFSREFQEGMSYKHTGKHEDCERSILLGDRGRNDPAKWLWGNEQNPVDAILLLYAVDNAALGAWETNIIAGLLGMDVKPLEQASLQGKKAIEHFGFRDGISQPIIKGFSKSNDNRPPAELVNPGEFILGFKNEYDNYSPSPYVPDDQRAEHLKYLPGHSDKKNLGRNGTYLIFRQIEQHVEEFWKYMVKESKEDGPTEQLRAEKLAAKMVGRWRDGRPLSACPEYDTPFSNNDLNEFKYEDDSLGKKCPFGSHIRRMNPRDQTHAGREASMSLEISSKHRMLRRGRTYGQFLNIDDQIEKAIAAQRLGNGTTHPNDVEPDVCLEPPRMTKPERGLHFICLVSDISRQFEFVQNVWGNTPTFAALTNEVDPLISPRKTRNERECHEFTAPKEKLRNRYKKVPEFTTVIGGEYFFMPGIQALEYILM